MAKFTDDIRVLFKSPDATYALGGTVGGQVVMYVREPTSAKRLKIAWIGKAYTEVPEGARRSVVFFHAENTFLSDSKIVWNSDDGRDIIPAGKYVFPFNFDVSSSCPPSFTAHRGSIDYCVSVWMETPNEQRQIRAQKFYMVPKPVDVAAIQAVQKPIECEGSLKSGTWMLFNGVVNYKFTLPRKCLIFGENVPIKVMLDNFCGCIVKKLKLRLIEALIYESPNSIGRKRTLRCEKVIAETEHQLLVLPGNLWNDTLQLAVPANGMPSFDGELVKREHLVEMKIYILCDYSSFSPHNIDFAFDKQAIVGGTVSGSVIVDVKKEIPVKAIKVGCNGMSRSRVSGFRHHIDVNSKDTFYNESSLVCSHSPEDIPIEVMIDNSSKCIVTKAKLRLVELITYKGQLSFDSGCCMTMTRRTIVAQEKMDVRVCPGFQSLRNPESRVSQTTS
ncbi:unnamed protein product [Caenorhabditis sp. 36 PRJEB53466]|nr:unnamed protein product [Caenorhabditis sp. 36 PRJEB53466]